MHFIYALSIPLQSVSNSFDNANIRWCRHIHCTSFLSHETVAVAQYSYFIWYKCRGLPARKLPKLPVEKHKTQLIFKMKLVQRKWNNISVLCNYKILIKLPFQDPAASISVSHLVLQRIHFHMRLPPNKWQIRITRNCWSHIKYIRLSCICISTFHV